MDTETDFEQTPLTTKQLRREALGHDALLFSSAFTVGAAVYFLVETVRQAASSSGSDFWSVSLSDNLILAGLLTGEAFLVWNNGLRQGRRGHSIGKHRVGLAVVDTSSGGPTGAVRGLLRGLVMAVLVDLSVAAVPVGFPTVLRRLTPDDWHTGGAAYVALLVLLVQLVVTSDRGLADRVARTTVVRGTGPGAVTTVTRSRLVSGIEVFGVLGVLAVAVTYIVFVAQFMSFPRLF